MNLKDVKKVANVARVLNDIDDAIITVTGWPVSTFSVRVDLPAGISREVELTMPSVSKGAVLDRLHVRRAELVAHLAAIGVTVDEPGAAT